MFLALDDLWLYNYHRVHYDGTALTIFETIQLIEEKRWEVVGLEETKEKVETSIRDATRYNPFSNRRYMEEERKNNLLINSTLDYFCFIVPLIIAFVFLADRLFVALPEQRGDLYFPRFQELLHPFSFNLETKLLQAVGILMMFLHSVAIHFTTRNTGNSPNTFSATCSDSLPPMS